MASSVTNNAQFAVNYLVGKGWTKEQAAGIIGNLQAESGVNLNTQAFNGAGGGKGAAGIAQWRSERQTGFEKRYGHPVTQGTLTEQLDYVNYELTQGSEKSAGNKIKATKTAADAAVATNNFYERSGGSAEAKRVGYANALVGATGGPTELPHTAVPTTPHTTTEPYDYAPGTYPYKIPGIADTRQTTKQYGTDINPDSIDFTKPLENVLHRYPSYIYSVSLHLLTADEYNNIISGATYIPNRVLVSSAGRYNNVPGINQFVRSQYFADDFYFDNINISTVIGTNALSRNTNAIEMSFTLIEPYGMTLINRLLDQANDPELKCSNYLDMVYLLQLDFFATNNAGEIVGAIPGTTKRFPIKLTQMNITAGTKGSEYQIHAVPYNHSAFDQSTVGIPANFEIVAGNLAEFFQSGTQANPHSQIASLPDALNSWQADLVKNNKIGAPDTYSFNIDPSISKSIFSSASTLSPRDTSMANPVDSNSIRLSNLGNATKDYNPQTRTFSINAGTSIDKVIDYTIRHSDYIQNQITIPDGVDPQTYLQEKAKNANQPLNWFKIVPTITLGPFDPVRKVYSRNITYSVTPYTIYNVKSDVAPQGKVTNFAKAYNYIYTGKNDDVIDFEINFNTLYYTAQTAYRGALTNIYKPAANADEANKSKNTDSYQGSDQYSNNVMPMVVKPQVFNAKARATGGAISAKNVAVADLEDSLMTMSAADMLNLQLKIIGDPQFIKQDDCFYSPLAVAVSVDDPRLTANGSLRTDYGEIYTKLEFRTPVDIDESTGMMKFNSKYRTSVFSGIYRVLTVSSDFRNGEFIQTLNLIRLPNQHNYDYSNNMQAESSQRNSDITTNNTAVLSVSPNVQNVGTPPAANNIAESTDQQPAQNTQADVVAGDKAVTTEQQNLRNVNSTADTKPIDANTLPPQLPPDATNAELAQNYRQKAAYFQTKSDQARAAGNTELANAYAEEVTTYQGYAARRDAMANSG